MPSKTTARNIAATKAAAAKLGTPPVVPAVLDGVLATTDPKPATAKPARKPAAAKPAAEQPKRTAVVEVPLSTGNRLVPDRRGESPKVTTATADFLAWVAASYGVDLSKPIAPEMLAVIATRKPQFQADIRDANPRAKGAK